MTVIQYTGKLDVIEASGLGIQERGTPISFREDLLTSPGFGPAPGAFIATTAGVNVDLSKFIYPGWAILKNLDPVNYVTYGTFDDATNVFYPFGELAPGLSIPILLSRWLGQAWDDAPGTGTSAPAGIVFFRIKANTADCKVSVEAYER